MIVNNSLQGSESVLSRDAWGNTIFITDYKIFSKGSIQEIIETNIDTDDNLYAIFISIFRKKFKKYFAITKSLPYISTDIVNDKNAEKIYPYHVVLPLHKIYAITKKQNKTAFVVDYDFKEDTILSIFSNETGNLEKIQIIRGKTLKDIKQQVEEIVKSRTENNEKIQILFLKRKKLQKGFKIANPFIELVEYETNAKKITTFITILAIALITCVWHGGSSIYNQYRIVQAESQISNLKNELKKTERKVKIIQQKIKYPKFTRTLQFEYQLVDILEQFPNFCKPLGQGKKGIYIDKECYHFLPEKLKKQAKYLSFQKKAFIPYKKGFFYQ